MISDEVDADHSVKADWRKFIALVFLFSFGFSIYGGVFQNFLRDVLVAGELDLGRLESMREIPGLLAALTAGTLVALAESRIAALGLAVCAVGIAATGLAANFWGLVAITVFWSVGFHLWATVQSAITLNLAKGREGGRHLGRMSGVGAVATIAALAVAWLTARLLPKLPYHFYFGLGGASIAVAALLCLTLTHHAATHQRQRLVFRREYGLFYFLTFLEGCRRQIFSIFASFALILQYGVPKENMLLLQLVNSVLIAATATQMGKWIDQVGERKPLTLYAVGLILVFAGYATFRNVGVLYALFIIDNILFSFNVGFTTYLHRIVRPGELTPCLAMGTTMNHIAAVSVPLLGAYLWHATGNYQLPFVAGAMIACVSLFTTLALPKGPRSQALA